MRRVQPGFVWAPALLPSSGPDAELEGLKRRAEQYVELARADNTRRAYAHDWAAFTGWCAQVGRDPQPASAQTLALYLTHLASLGRRPSTILEPLVLKEAGPQAIHDRLRQEHPESRGMTS